MTRYTLVADGEPTDVRDMTPRGLIVYLCGLLSPEEISKLVLTDLPQIQRNKLRVRPVSHDPQDCLQKAGTVTQGLSGVTPVV